MVIKKRWDDLHASIKDNPAIWGCGNNVYQALGNLIYNHPESFNVNIEYSDDQLTQKYLSGD